MERVQESGLGAFEFTVQLLSAVFKHRALRWIESDVLQLRRVSCEIVEFLYLIGNKLAHILVSALPQGEPPRHVAEIVRACFATIRLRSKSNSKMLSEQRVFDRLVWFIQQRTEIMPVHFPWQRHSGESEDCGGEIDDAYRLATNRAARDASRQAENQRHSKAGIVGSDLPCKTMLTPSVALIGCEDDERVLELTGFRERPDQLAHSLIHTTDEAIVAAHRHGNGFPFVSRRTIRSALEHGPVAHVTLFVHPRAEDIGGHGNFRVHIEAVVAGTDGGWEKLCAHWRRSSSPASVIPLSQAHTSRFIILVLPCASRIMAVSLRRAAAVPSFITELCAGAS